MLFKSFIIWIVISHCMGYPITEQGVGLFFAANLFMWIIGGAWDWLQNIFDECQRQNRLNN